ncbi:DUF3221 domain-containing protein [Lysinibacillus sp. ZYM-1]|uniref:DUF3221 domain-containing protein n=1 Tax=Lysinibacillus sp. ZYM-1 TaxID=1681184 RepID=UPI0006CE89A4|nr:DUF3221 domain-containing protein [Lysinibacillus sp. ZYM-1]KPN94584.1 hypothetical protein AO843_22920 [Lysinibacillus sp. ZYM-1]
MSKVDVRVVRDLSESKKRVMANVVQQLEQRDEKNSSKRWQYGVLTIILNVCLGLFILNQYKDNLQQASNIPPVLDERIIELQLQKDTYFNGKKRLYRASFDSFLYLESTFANAQSRKFIPSLEQVEKELEQIMEDFSYDTMPTMNERLQMLQMTEEEFIATYGMSIAYKMASVNLLMEASRADYINTSDQIRTWFVEQEAMHYLKQHYRKDIASLQEKYRLPEKESQMMWKRSGTVLAIKEHEFLVVSGVFDNEVGQLSVDELVQKHSNGTWFPLVDVPKTLSVGDRVEVQYSQAIGNDGSQPFIDFKDIVEMKIVKEY